MAKISTRQDVVVWRLLAEPTRPSGQFFERDIDGNWRVIDTWHLQIHIFGLVGPFSTNFWGHLLRCSAVQDRDTTLNFWVWEMRNWRVLEGFCGEGSGFGGCEGSKLEEMGDFDFQRFYLGSFGRFLKTNKWQNKKNKKQKKMAVKTV